MQKETQLTTSGSFFCFYLGSKRLDVLAIVLTACLENAYLTGNVSNQGFASSKLVIWDYTQCTALFLFSFFCIF